MTQYLNYQMKERYIDYEITTTLLNGKLNHLLQKSMKVIIQKEEKSMDCIRLDSLRREKQE